VGVIESYHCNIYQSSLVVVIIILHAVVWRCANDTIISGQMDDSCSTMVLQYADCYGRNSMASGSGYFCPVLSGRYGNRFRLGRFEKQPCPPSAVDQEGGSWLLDIPYAYPKSYPKVCLMTSLQWYYGGARIWWEHKGSMVGTGL
jgi:hypothetical protein